MKKEMPNLKLVKTNLILDRFAQADLRQSILVLALRDKKKGYLSGLGKAISTIKEYVANLLHFFLKEKTTPEIWSILESRFWHVSPMSISALFLDGYTKKSAKFENIIDYTICY